MQDLHSGGWRDAINKKKGLDIHHIRKAFKVGYLVGFGVSSKTNLWLRILTDYHCSGWASTTRSLLPSWSSLKVEKRR